MEIINITEEQKKELCDELARLTFQFRNNRSVKCICFSSYKGLGEMKGNILNITIIKDIRENDHFDEELNEYNLRYQEHDSIRQFGLKIFLDVADVRNYQITDLNSIDSIRGNDLRNSIILYDESGQFTRIKEESTKKTDAPTYDNLAEIYPPLAEELDKALATARMERDSKAVKEFTKTKLFKYIKNM